MTAHASAMAIGTSLVREGLQVRLIDTALMLNQEERVAVMAGLLCQVTSLGVVLIGQAEMQQLLATSVYAAASAPRDAVDEAAAMRALVDGIVDATGGASHG